MSLEDIEKAIQLIPASKIVSCPIRPVMIPGITAGDAFDANDCFGTIVKLPVPKRGIIYSATFYDIDDEGSQVDLEVFNGSITQIASDAAWAPSTTDILRFVTEIAFFAFDDHINCQTSELLNIGKAYIAPDGVFYIQAVCRGTPTIAAGASPKFKLGILSLDPDFMEK
ncbi:MAG: hypothetical protein PHU23_17735 [Dehalococcoidales bacterium]|nr:hypothetical protein [Dehalococcoidales bacterium]